MKTIQIDHEVYEYILSKAEPGEAPAATLRRELALPEPTEEVEVDDETYAFLVSKAENFGESPSDVLRRELNVGQVPNPDPNPEPNPTPEPNPNPDPEPAPTPEPDGMIVFHIPAGTGTQAWNTRETAVAGKVGETLRIFNDDSIAHRLHTDGGPFPHPATDIEPGQSADYVLQSVFNADGSHALYDHDTGTSAQFWITVRAAQ